MVDWRFTGGFSVVAILLTHEWLARAGGSENVFEQMVSAFPQADRYCLWNDAPERFSDVRETWLARTPLRRNKALALPFVRPALRTVPVGRYDTVVSSSHLFGHFNATRATARGARGFAYVHSPARYIWTPEFDSRGQSPFVRAVSPALQRMDRRTVSPRVRYAANSLFVRNRMRSAWGVDAEVIYPPVAVEEITDSLRSPMTVADEGVIDRLPSDYILGASRLIGYKQLDRVIELASLLGRPVVIAGDGPERSNLEHLAARSGVESYFVGRVSNRLLFELYRRAALFVFLPVEDFGIMPLEAIAAGAPVLVNYRGGAWEGVERTGAGMAVDLDSGLGIVEAAKVAMKLKDHAGGSQVAPFSNSSFRTAISEWVRNG